MNAASNSSRTINLSSFVSPKRNSSLEERHQPTKDENNIGIKINDLELILDANCVPTWEQILDDQNLNNFMQLTDIIDSALEGLPILIIQFINNQQDNNWSTMNKLFFVTAFVSVVYNSINLIRFVLDDNIVIFYKSIEFLMEKRSMHNFR